MEHAHLITLAEQFAAHVGRSEATVSNWIVAHARLFSRLRAGHGTTVKTYQRALEWFSANWPTGLPWPVEIPRPVVSAHADASDREAGRSVATEAV